MYIFCMCSIVFWDNRYMNKANLYSLFILPRNVCIHACIYERYSLLKLKDFLCQASQILTSSNHKHTQGLEFELEFGTLQREREREREKSIHDDDGASHAYLFFRKTTNNY